MIVTGTHIERMTVHIEVDPTQVIDNMRRFWLKSIGHANHYINTHGVWEDWEDTGHGSGLYKRFGEATEDQKKMNNAFDALQCVAKAMNDKK